MAIIPQFNGGQAIPTAKPNAPVLDRERRPRVDTGEIMGAMGASAQAFAQAGKAAEMPTMPLNTYDGQYNGAQAIAQGFQHLNKAMHGIAMKKAEARNYADVSEHVTRMQVRAAKFDEFKLNNPDPDSWGPEWQNQVAAMKKEFDANDKLSPAARDEINQRFSRFSQVQAAQIDNEATVATFARAREASEAEFVRYLDQGNLPGAMANLEARAKAGYIHEDDKARAEILAREHVQAKELETLSWQVKEAMTRGEFPKAKELIRQSSIPIEEQDAQIADIEVRAEQKQLVEQLEDRAWIEPDKVIEEIGEYDVQKGAYTKHQSLSGEARRSVLQSARTSIADMQGEAMSVIQDRLTKPGVNSLDDLKEVPYFDRLSDFQKAKIITAINEPRNNRGQFVSALRSIAEFDYKEDDPLKEADLLAQIDFGFDGAYAAQLKDRFTKAKTEYEKSLEAGGIGGSGFTRAKREIYRMAENAAKSGAFGVTEVKYGNAQQVSQQTQNLRDTRKIDDNSMVIDLARQAKVDEALLNVVIEMENWASKEENRDATPYDMKEQMKKLIGDTSGAGAETLIEMDFGIFGPNGEGSEATLFPSNTGDAVSPEDARLNTLWESMNKTR